MCKVICKEDAKPSDCSNCKCLNKGKKASDEFRKGRAHHASLIREACKAAYKHVACDALPENLHTQHIGNDLLCLLRRGPGTDPCTIAYAFNIKPRAAASVVHSCMMKH